MNFNDLIKQVRRDIVLQVYNANSGHPGGSLGCVELMVALYFKIMNHDSRNFKMDGTHQDHFFLSNGHISPVWYSVLSRSGYFPTEYMKSFRMLNSQLQGHPTCHDGLSGIRMSSGSLGQGLSVAIGSAISKKMNRDESTVYCLMGDGELQEGQIWEAAMYAAANQVDNLIAIVDVNGQQIDGSTDSVLSLGDLYQKWRAFGWQVINCDDGNNFDDVVTALKLAKNSTGRGNPVIILLKTKMGNGVSFMMGSHKWHGIAPNFDQLQQALEENINDTYNDF